MECTVYKEIRTYREGIFMGLSLRQSIWGGVTLLTAIGSYFGLGFAVSKELASTLCLLLAALPAAVGFLQYQGLTFEQLACACLRTMLRHSGWYVYRAVSIFDTLHRAAEEEQRRAQRKQKKTRRKDKKNHAKT